MKGQLEGSRGWQEGPEGQLEGSESQLEGHEGYTAGYKGQPGGMDGQTDKQNFSPFHRILSPLLQKIGWNEHTRGQRDGPMTK